MLKTSSDMLERALEIALEVHKGVPDKAGAPYILHPIRVALSLDREPEQVVGLLHDVLEDGQSKGWTRSRLAGEGFPEDLLDALDCVTKRPDELGDDRYGQPAGLGDEDRRRPDARRWSPPARRCRTSPRWPTEDDLAVRARPGQAPRLF